VQYSVLLTGIVCSYKCGMDRYRMLRDHHLFSDSLSEDCKERCENNRQAYARMSTDDRQILIAVSKPARLIPSTQRPAGPTNLVLSSETTDRRIRRPVNGKVRATPPGVTMATNQSTWLYNWRANSIAIVFDSQTQSLNGALYWPESELL